ncbi:conserved hypothetical protein [delta proteobacterium NaphS2]|nr:conserved hypothetical protein [delta proteobacterium NaphS2]
MSDALRIAFVVEGPTDFVMLKSIMKNFLKGHDFISQVLQPEISEAFKTVPGTDGGWSGVLRWCLQAADQGRGKLSDNPLFVFHDLLNFHLDADVAGVNYEDGHVQDPFSEPTLPCEEDCPPASATTDRLRTVALRWMGEQAKPAQMVFCTPSKALETWLLAALFPDDKVSRMKDLECRQDPASTLQGKPKKCRLVRSGKKDLDMYVQFAPEVAANWNRVTAKCSEARRFEDEFICTRTELPQSKESCF